LLKPAVGTKATEANSATTYSEEKPVAAKAVSKLVKQNTRREVAKAIAAIARAQRQLRTAEHRLETDVGPENASELLDEIKNAEKRLALARIRLRDLHPDGAASPEPPPVSRRKPSRPSRNENARR
jgi:hypothetical protein